jgi:two-component system, sensor histidine kinase PdtaS
MYFRRLASYFTFLFLMNFYLAFSSEHQTGKTVQADSLSLSGIKAFEKGEYTQAKTLYQKALKIYQNNNDETAAARVLANLGMVYTKQGDYTKALEYQLIAVSLFEKEKDKESLVRAYNAIANIYRKQKDYGKSLKYHNESVKLRLELKDEQGLGVSYMNIGNVYRDMKRYPEALKYYNRSLPIKYKYEEEKSISLLLDNIGLLYFELGKYPDAERHFLNSLEIMTKVEDRMGMGELANDLGKLYSTIGRFDLADKYLSRGLQLAEETNSKDLLLDYYKTRRLFNLKQNKLRQALYFDSLYDVAKDSIFSEEKSKAMAEMQVKYETDIKDREIILLNEQKRNQVVKLQLAKANMKTITVILSSAAILAIVIAIAFWKLYRIKRKSEQQKEMMMREMHHRVKNNMQLILGMFGLQSNHLKNKDEKDVVTEMENRVKAMMMVHQQLYKDAYVEAIRMDDFIKELTHNICRSYRFSIENLQLNLDKIEMETDRAISVGLIVNELLVNAMKYGVKEGNGKVAVNLSEVTEHWILEVKDSGNGVSTNRGDESPNQSFGLFLVKSLSSQLKADFQMKNGMGAHISLHVPRT